jgi:hypothetical protein
MEKKLNKKYEDKKIIIQNGNFGWDYETIIDFFTDSSIVGFSILGGDVLKYNKISECYEPTYDSWYIDRKGPEEDFESYCIRSRENSLEYITNYKFKEGIIFCPVISSEITGGL